MSVVHLGPLSLFRGTTLSSGNFYRQKTSVFFPVVSLCIDVLLCRLLFKLSCERWLDLKRLLVYVIVVMCFVGWWAKWKGQILVISTSRPNKTAKFWLPAFISRSSSSSSVFSSKSEFSGKNTWKKKYKIKNHAYPASMNHTSYTIRTNELVSTLELLQRKESLTPLPVARKAWLHWWIGSWTWEPKISAFLRW